MRPPQNAGEDSNWRRGTRQGAARFNETPAERGGRQLVAVRGRSHPDRASMRPPQNAGEDPLASALPVVIGDAASMRPPQNAGEDGIRVLFHVKRHSLQ